VDLISETKQPAFNMKGHRVASVLQTKDRGAGYSSVTQA